MRRRSRARSPASWRRDARQSGVPCHAIVGEAALGLFERRIIDLQTVQEAGTIEQLEAAGAALAEQLSRRRPARARLAHAGARISAPGRGYLRAMAERPRPYNPRSTPRRAVVVGAGSFGTAVAVLLARGGLRTTLQTRTPEQAARLVAARENRAYLPEVKLPTELRIEHAGAGLSRAESSSSACRRAGWTRSIAALPHAGMNARAAVVSLAKGLVPPDGRSPSIAAARALRRAARLRSSAVRRTRARWSTRAPGSSRRRRTRSSRG